MRKAFLKWTLGEKDELLDKIIEIEWVFDELQGYFTQHEDNDIVFALDDTLTTINKLIKVLKGQQK